MRDLRVQNSSSVFHLFEFHPDRIWLCDNPAHSGNSELLVSARKGDQSCINYFSNMIYKWVDENLSNKSIQAVCYVPHRNDCRDLNHVGLMARDLAKSIGIMDMTSILKVRYPKGTMKLRANSINGHSYYVIGDDRLLLKNKMVLLLDDVTLDMRSILICEQLLLKAGVTSVIKLVLGRMANYAQS